MSLANQINGSLWPIHEPALEDVRAFLRNPNDFNALEERDDGEFASRLIEADGPLATIKVRGKIFPRANILARSSGATSVQELSKAVDEVEEDESIEKVLFHVDSPGGNGTGIPNLTKKIREMETETVAFAQGRMASAAYWIGSAANEVFSSPIARVGSIGTYALLVSQSEMLEDKGIETKVVRSSPLKGVRHPSEPISEESVKKTQRVVDRLTEEFIADVAKNRNLSKEHVQNTMTDGDVRVGSDAEEEGFTDGTMTLEELYSSFEFDEEDDKSRKDQQISFLEDTVGRLLEEKSQLSEQTSKLQDRLDELKSETREKEIDRVLTRAIEEDNKFVPGRRDELKAKLEEDFEGTVEMIDMVEEGAASPNGPVETENSSDSTMEEKIDQLESQGILVARTDLEEEIYAKSAGYEEGEDYVVKSKIGSYGFFD